MRECPKCNQLIQDAAIHCRFCRQDVAPMMACSEEWLEFARKFHHLSPRKQQMAWDELSTKDQVYVQKTLGILPPKLPGIREALADMAESKRRRQVARVRSLVGLAAACVVAIIGVVLLYPYLEPFVEDDGVDGVELSTAEKFDRVLDRVSISVIALAEKISGRKMAMPKAAEEVASEVEPTTQAMESLTLAPDLSPASGNP